MSIIIIITLFTCIRKHVIELTLRWKDTFERMQSILRMIYSSPPSGSDRRGRHGSETMCKREHFVIVIAKPTVPRETRTREKRAKQKLSAKLHLFNVRFKDYTPIIYYIYIKSCISYQEQRFYTKSIKYFQESN